MSIHLTPFRKMIGYQKILGLLPFGKSEPSIPNMKELFKEFDEIMEESHRAQLAVAQEEASAGTGPQTWDADWFENSIDFSEEAEDMVRHWTWQQINVFQEILDMAMNSPQAQRGLELQDDINSPWNDALEMIEGMQRGLRWRSHELLYKQAKGLNYSKEMKGDLDDALEEILNPENQ